MLYEKFPAPESLSSFVECAYVLTDNLKKDLIIQSPPNGFTAMVFCLEHSYKVFQGDQVPQLTPRAFLSGQFTSNYHLILNGHIRIVGIVFKPSAIYNLFGIRMSNLTNSRMPLNYVLKEDADRLFEQVRLAKNDQDQASILFGFLNNRLQEINYKRNEADEAIDIIDQHKGNITIKEVAKTLNVSQRTLEKWFLDKVGISPKLYARIKRFSILSNIVAHKENVDWQQVLFEAGFHDQSHLIKDYLDFNKMNPAKYHHEHHEAIRFIKK